MLKQKKWFVLFAAFVLRMTAEIIAPEYFTETVYAETEKIESYVKDMQLSGLVQKTEEVRTVTTFTDCGYGDDDYDEKVSLIAE